VRDWIQNYQRSAAIVGITLVLPLLLLLYLVGDFLAVRQGYQQEIERLEPRIARLKGLTESEQRLAQSADRLGSRLRDLAYPVSLDRATVSATLQNNVREIVATAGLSVTNSQVLPVREEEGFDRIGVKLTVSGDVAALDAALMELSTYVPLLLIESIEIWPERQSRRSDTPPPQRLTASLQLLSLRSTQ
jgi:general secretion pathway protein M